MTSQPNTDWMADKRRCGECGEEKPVDEFGFRNRARGWRQGYCKPCMARYHARWWQLAKRVRGPVPLGRPVGS